MGEFHVKRITLPSGKTVEIVYYQMADGEPVAAPMPTQIEAAAELQVRRIELCLDCASDRVHPVDWHEVADMRWELSLRCPDCEWRSRDVFDQPEVERYDDVLNDATDRLIEELDRVTRENMTEAVDRFRLALENDGIMPFDFQGGAPGRCRGCGWPAPRLAASHAACGAQRGLRPRLRSSRRSILASHAAACASRPASSSAAAVGARPHCPLSSAP